METRNTTKKKIVVDRGRFVLEVMIVFFGICLFMIIPLLFLRLLIDVKSTFYGPLYYLLRALGILIAIPLFLFILNKFLDSPIKNHSLEDDSSPVSRHLNLYSVPGGYFKQQLLYGILILFIVFIPLDFLTYFLIPEMLEFTGNVLSTQATDAYLLRGYFVFLFSVIIIQISVAIYEESLTRGFLTMRGGEYFHKISAVIISSLYFGLMHFLYYFHPISRNYPVWFPLIWFLQTFTVGIMLSIFIVKKKKIWPLIFAHALNNIISAHAVWNYLQGNDFSLVAIYLYFPLLIISGFIAVLFIIYFPRIKQGISTGFDEFKIYFKKDDSIGESKSDLYFRVFFDFLIGLLILIIGLFFLI
ncbi:MAG: CPBP family intramembrane metalloprotease [Promethearchaeota archaeon]|nr:MAG: CPBP family intramembrane metalloprotease [Candidatus Lokiarchaeota archaeon]